MGSSDFFVFAAPGSGLLPLLYVSFPFDVITLLGTGPFDGNDGPSQRGPQNPHHVPAPKYGSDVIVDRLQTACVDL